MATNKTTDVVETTNDAAAKPQLPFTLPAISPYTAAGQSHDWFYGRAGERNCRVDILGRTHRVHMALQCYGERDGADKPISLIELLAVVHDGSPKQFNSASNHITVWLRANGFIRTSRDGLPRGFVALTDEALAAMKDTGVRVTPPVAEPKTPKTPKKTTARRK